MNEFGGPSEAEKEAQGAALAQEIVTLRAVAKTDAEHQVVIQKLEALHQLYGAPLPGEKKWEGTGIELSRATEIIGAESCFGPAAVEKAFGIRLEAERIPPIQFSESELKRAEELGQMLILRVDRTADGSALTMKKMSELLQPTFEQNEEKILYDEPDWYEEEVFYKEETPALSWALVSRETIPDSTSKNYLQQTDQLVTYLETEVFQGQSVPPPYSDALNEFRSVRAQIEPLVTSQIEAEWKQASQMLADLKLNQLTRQTPAEVLYDMLVVIQNSTDPEEKTRLLENMYTWTARRGSVDGYLVGVGDFDADGADVGRWRPGDAHPAIGVVFSRSQSES